MSFGLLDHYLIAARTPERITRRARALAMTSSSESGTRTRGSRSGPARRSNSVSVSLPEAEPYFDLAGIQVLRNAYELYKRDDLVSDLTMLTSRSRSKPGSTSSKAYTHLALCYLNGGTTTRTRHSRN